MENNRVFLYLQVIFGSVLFALGLYFFITPSGLNSGGIIGFAQLFDYFIQSFVNVPVSLDLTGIINMALNIPLFMLAFRSISKEFCFKTLLSVVVQMLTLSLLPRQMTPVMDDVLSNVIFGAIVGGFGIGLTLRSSGCAGGMDILGVYFSKMKPNFSVGKLSIFLNIVLFAICAVVFDVQSTLYSIIFVLIMYFVCDKVHYQNINMTAFIFTKKAELKNEIMTRTGRGVTYWIGKGAYTDNDLYILYTALNKYEIRRLNKIVKEIDPNAFITLSEGQKISGGFEKRL